MDYRWDNLSKFYTIIWLKWWLKTQFYKSNSLSFFLSPFDKNILILFLFFLKIVLYIYIYVYIIICKYLIYLTVFMSKIRYVKAQSIVTSRGLLIKCFYLLTITLPNFLFLFSYSSILLKICNIPRVHYTSKFPS